LESGALRSEGERGLCRAEKAEGGGARESIWGGGGSSSLVWVVGGGTTPRRRDAGTGSIFGISWSSKEKWSVGFVVSLSFATSSTFSKKPKSRPYSWRSCTSRGKKFQRSSTAALWRTFLLCVKVIFMASSTTIESTSEVKTCFLKISAKSSSCFFAQSTNANKIRMHPYYCNGYTYHSRPRSP